MKARFLLALGLAAGALALAAPASAPARQTAPAAGVAERGSGAHPAMLEEVASLPNHVVYRPRDLARLGDAKLGIYVFGNGGCSADGTSSRNHLLEIASHGYIAVASGTIPVPGAIPAAGPQPNASGRLTTRTTAAQLSEAIDWAVAENARSGSPLHDKIATDRIAVSGFSCGGLQALEIAMEPRVTTLVMMNTGVFRGGASPIAGMTADKTLIDRLHGSALYVMGGPTDIAYENGMDDYRRIGTLPAAMVNIPVGHGGTYHEPHGGIAAQVVTAWLDWKLKGDAAAGARFKGADCGFCGDKRLTIETKNLD